MKQLVILAGGKGTRLSSRTQGLPKPLIPIGGKPLLEHQVQLAKFYGFTHIVVFISYRADVIQQALGNGERWGVEIKFVTEEKPLGTAGALLAGIGHLAERFVVLYGDTFVNLDLGRLDRFHEGKGASATLVLHPNNHPLDSDLVEVDEQDRIVRFRSRPHPAGVDFRNLVNAGLYVIERSLLVSYLEKTGWGAASALATLLDFGEHLFPTMLGAGAFLAAYDTCEYIKDIGTPERYDKVCAQFEAGVIQRSSFATAQRAVFLDRDGTLIRDVGASGVVEPDGVALLQGVARALKKLNEAGIRAVVVTNQPGVAKGFVTEAGVQAVHRRLETSLGREGAFIDRIYWCPHHPDKGFPGELPELKIRCSCRKPEIGMLTRAIADFNIDVTRSWLVGDTTTDIRTAKRAGVRSILVRTGQGGADRKYPDAADHVVDDLSNAVEIILQQTTHDYQSNAVADELRGRR